jgi:hypothetical protein
MPPQSVKRKDAGHIPGPVVIPNAVTMRLIWNLANGKQVFDVLHVIVPSTYSVTVANVNLVGGPILSAFTSSGYAALVPTTQSFVGIDMRDIRPPGNFALVAGTGTAVPGTSVSPAMPPGVCLVATVRTAQAGRAFRGRIYYPAWATNADAGNGSAVNPTVNNAMNSFNTAILNALTGQGLQLGLAQPARANYLGVTGTNHPSRAANIITVTAVVLRDNVWDSQRRRALVA